MRRCDRRHGGRGRNDRKGREEEEEEESSSFQICTSEAGTGISSPFVLFFGEGASRIIIVSTVIARIAFATSPP